jgi:hypothetical protein
MKKHLVWVLLLAFCGVATAQFWKKDKDKKGAAAAMPDHRIVQPKDVQWGDPPPVLAAGAKMAVIEGDPSKPGIFIIRLKMPNNYRVMPHWHPTAEYVTVISGNFSVGIGDKFNEKSMTQLGPAGFVAMDAKSHHYGKSMGPETIIQIGGTGPFVLNYVDPKDDPSKSAAAAPAKTTTKKK